MPPWPVKLERGCIPSACPLRLYLAGARPNPATLGGANDVCRAAVGPWDAPNALAGAAQRGAAAPHPTARPAPLAGNYLITTWDMWRAAIPY